MCRAKKLGISVVIALLALPAVTPAAAAQDDGTPGSASESAIPAANREPLRPGDAIRLRFWREPDLSGEYTVDERGAAVLPILGTRALTDVSAEELKRRLHAEYAQHIRDQAVEITPLRRVTIIGSVNQPGLYHVDPTMTLADAVALAGGSRREGKLDAVKVLRGGEEIRSNLDSSQPVLNHVRSGDQIFVPERSWIARNPGVIIGASISVLGLLLSQVF